MFGANPKRPPTQGDGSALEVKHIFATLQGEGPFAGWPAVFIRLAGCNLACDFCDTEFEDGNTLSVDEMLARVQLLAHGQDGAWLRTLVVITGGEPLRQPIAPLCEALQAAGYTVQIETNGTLYRPLPEGVQIVCSPKHTGSGYMPLREDLLERTNALKFLISADRPGYGDVVDVGQSRYAIPVYVQPLDEYDAQRNEANFERTTRLAMEKGYRLSLQLHKWLGIE